MAALEDKKNAKVNPDRVRAEVRYVRNLGNYETVTISLGVERDVPDDVPYLEALRRVYGEVSNEVEKAVKEVDAEAGKVNKTGA